jgi:hypothetical protein
MNHNIPRTGVQGTPKKKAEPKYPKADWSKGSYHDTENLVFMQELEVILM